MIWKMTYLAKYSNLQMTQKYSERLLMIQINKVVCKCIHIRYGNMDEEYKSYAVLGRTTQKRT